MTTAHPIALTIAGSDCSGGAGLQADLKTFQSFAVHGLSAVTSIVAETPLEVRQIEPVEIPLLQAQLNILLETYPIGAAKTGLLPSRMCIIAVSEVAETLKKRGIPIVVDPVMIASTGASLIDGDTSSILTNRLLPLSALVTPNIPEAEVLLNRKITTEADLETAARDIAGQFQVSCLVKGGHLPGDSDRLDVLWHQGEAHPFRHPYANIPGGIHGTGCTLSSAITAGLALGHSMEKAVPDAIEYVQGLIQSAHTWKHSGKNNGMSVRCLGW
ncbi:MAG: bifunctional hydroxymethylpyrimidine kinase/phosphomethylpyrimidine kinase [Akkermansiaceae bacterium]|nr:bifunctional hydroxymethylpyrimidine kinase/phosphomethylpyrimidine kinase [Akkermansiaceae bacterium]